MSVASKRTKRAGWHQALSFGWAILLALFAGLLLLMLDGYSPGEVLSAAGWGSFSSSYRAANTLARLVIITLAALAAAVPFSAGMWNIGGDGQLTIGAFAAAYVGFTYPELPAMLHLGLAIAAAMLGGMLWAGLPAILRLRFQADEIVTTIMLNYVAVLLTGYLVNYPFRAPGSPSPQSVRMPASATLTQLVPLSNLSSGLFIAAIAYLIILFIMRNTVWGYEWRVLGANKRFARYGGVHDRRMLFLSMCIGGALAGLAGGILVLGVHHRFVANISGGAGFNGVLIALIAANSPVIVLVISAIFALLQSGVVGMEGKLGVAIELSDILQSLIIFMVIIRGRLWQGIQGIFKRRVKE
jgi:simple sugar transport system permease protein